MLKDCPMVPVDAINIALVLALAFFVGLEREEHKQQNAGYAFGGVTTFPLIGLVSYALALIGAPDLVPWLIGFAVVGGFMLLSYFHKLSCEPPAGVLTEICGLATYVVGGMVQHDYYWIATTIAVLSVLLLQLKKWLESLTKHVASNEIITVAKFLVLAVVILPVVPDRELTRFHLDPFRIWLVVVAVSGVSFASYVLQRVLKGRGGIVLSAVLGGAYSSTVTTVVLARQAAQEHRPQLFSGSIVVASGVMYLRLVVLLALFSLGLAGELAPAFATLGVIGGLVGWRVSRRADGASATADESREPRNPLELGAAFLFAIVFVVVLILTSLAREYLGRAGLYSLAAIMGVTDVDPFILGLAQGTSAISLPVAAASVVIAAASNNLIKAVYAYAFADRPTGRRAFVMLIAFALLGLIPLVWISA